jgi:hypothetical protein
MSHDFPRKLERTGNYKEGYGYRKNPWAYYEEPHIQFTDDTRTPTNKYSESKTKRKKSLSERELKRKYDLYQYTTSHNNRLREQHDAAVHYDETGSTTYNGITYNSADLEKILGQFRKWSPPIEEGEGKKKSRKVGRKRKFGRSRKFGRIK